MHKLHLKTIEGDKAFHYRNIDEDFQGGVLTHVDDFELTGTDDFVEEIIGVVAKDTDHDNLGKPLDGQPLGGLCTPVAPLTHLEHTLTETHLNIFHNKILISFLL